MSGVYIKGMEMPTSCHDCRFCGWSNFWQSYNCHMTKNHALLLFNGEKTNSDSKTRNGRADNCPITPVPDHGRLIDADASLYNLGRIVLPDDLAYTIGHDMAKRFFEKAPTMIPADKEGE